MPNSTAPYKVFETVGSQLSSLIRTSELQPQKANLARLDTPQGLDDAKPRVLVLLATFNGGRWIKEQLDSILQQVRVDICVAINDDCSTDETLAALKSFTRDYRIQLTTSTKRSGSAAQNFFHLIRNNSSEGFDFVALADQDDLWAPDKLHRACDQAEKNPFSGYSSAVTAVWDNGRRSLLKQEHAPTASDYLFEGAGQGCTFVLSAEFYESLRNFIVNHKEITNILHYHDWAIYALARAWGVEWRFDPNPSMQYRQHGRNDTGARNSLRGIRRRLSLIRSGWYRTQLSVIAQLCNAGAPTNPIVTKWLSILTASPNYKRKLRMALFCMQGGRRRKFDTIVLLIASLIGWI